MSREASNKALHCFNVNQETSTPCPDINIRILPCFVNKRKLMQLQCLCSDHSGTYNTRNSTLIVLKTSENTMQTQPLTLILKRLSAPCHGNIKSSNFFIWDLRWLPPVWHNLHAPSVFVCCLVIECVYSESEGWTQHGCVYIWLSVYLSSTSQTPEGQSVYTWQGMWVTTLHLSVCFLGIS